MMPRFHESLSDKSAGEQNYIAIKKKYKFSIFRQDL